MRVTLTVALTLTRGGKSKGPGLAMTRCLGDFDAADVGVVGTPTVSHRELLAGDAFLVLASDGIWEVRVRVR